MIVPLSCLIYLSKYSKTELGKKCFEEVGVWYNQLMDCKKAVVGFSLGVSVLTSTAAGVRQDMKPIDDVPSETLVWVPVERVVASQGTATQASGASGLRMGSQV